MRLRHRLALLAAAPILALATGCTNPFTPATPEKPPPGDIVIPVYSSTDALLSTIASAMSSRGASGRIAYQDALADSTGADTHAFYAFHPPTVVDAWRLETGLTPPDTWTKPLEMKCYDYLGQLDPGFTYIFTWAPDDQSGLDPPPTDTDAMVHRHYSLVAKSADGNTVKSIAIGYADLYMQKVGARWYLYRWEDRIDATYAANNPDDVDAVCMGRRRLNSTSGGL